MFPLSHTKVKSLRGNSFPHQEHLILSSFSCFFCSWLGSSFWDFSWSLLLLSWFIYKIFAVGVVENKVRFSLIFFGRKFFFRCFSPLFLVFCPKISEKLKICSFLDKIEVSCLPLLAFRRSFTPFFYKNECVEKARKLSCKCLLKLGEKHSKRLKSFQF